MSKLSKRAITLFVIATMILSMLSAFIAVPVMAVTITAVTPTDIPVGPAYTALTGPIIVETSIAEFGVGTIVLTAPAGFEFDTTASSVTATVAPGDLLLVGLAVQTVTPTVSTITIDVSQVSTAVSTITYTGIEIRATSTVSGATGSLDFSGTSLVTGSAGTLTSIHAAASKLVFTTEPSSTGYVNDPFTVQPVVEIQDTYDNLVDSTATVVLTATAGATGSLTGTISKAAVAGVATFTDISYDDTDTITITATSGGLTDAVSTTITLVPEPTGEFTIDLVSPLGDVVYDDVLTVFGSGVTAGSEVIAYWDYATGTLIHPLNNTEGNPDGSFDLEVTIPSDVVGDHYLWVKDVATGATIGHGPITIVPKITLSPSSGLVGDEVTIKGYGFSEEAEVTFTFGVPVLVTVPATVETDDDGYFSCTFDVPTGSIYQPYDIVATEKDTPANEAIAEFIVGASISLDPEEGPSGTVVDITGVGWTPTEIIALTMDGETVVALDVDDLTIDGNGEFSAEVVIPSMADEKKYDITATETGGLKGPASTKFDVTGNSAIEIAPGYGPPGGSVEIKGYNFTQISGTEITLTLIEKLGPGDEPVDTIEVDSNGEFSETVRIPAVDYGTWEIWAEDIVYGLDAKKDFRIGIMIVIVSPSYGPTGTPMYLTGIGFSDGGSWNATMDGVAITDDSVTIPGGTEAISKTIYIPTVPVDTYDITVLDIDTEIEVLSTFVVTATTEAFADPASAPNTYKVIFEGHYFAQDVGADLEFILFNATESWDITNEVNLYDSDPDSVIPLAPYTELDAVLDTDGNFTAWWEIWDEDELSLGCYKVNVTDDHGLFAEISLCLVEERIYIKPLKAKFDIGDTVSFDIKNDFDYDDSYMEIRDPDNSLYWRTKPFDKQEDDWLKDADLYTVPYYGQTSGGNPMTLSTDAPLGIWFWAFYTSEDKQLVNGTFEVGPSLESLLTDQMAALSEELGMDIDTLRTYIDDLGIDMDEAVTMMAEDIAAAVSGMEDDISDLSDDLDDAVTGMQGDIDDMGNKMDSIETMVDDISGTSTAAQEAANEAKNSAEQAADAADANRQQTSGLTTLVYGAIGASLIAALAAVVSLMQISRRIAG